MHAVRQHDVNDVNLGIVFDRIVVVVVVDILRVHVVTSRQFVGFVAMAADQGDDFRLVTLRERGQDLVDRETAQPDHCPAHLFARRIGYLQLRRRAPQKGSGNICCNNAAADAGQKSPAGNLVLNRIRHLKTLSCRRFD